MLANLDILGAQIGSLLALNRGGNRASCTVGLDLWLQQHRFITEQRGSGEDVLAGQQAMSEVHTGTNLPDRLVASPRSRYHCGRRTGFRCLSSPTCSLRSHHWRGTRRIRSSSVSSRETISLLCCHRAVLVAGGLGILLVEAGRMADVVGRMSFDRLGAARTHFVELAELKPGQEESKRLSR